MGCGGSGGWGSCLDEATEEGDEQLSRDSEEEEECSGGAGLDASLVRLRALYCKA